MGGAAAPRPALAADPRSVARARGRGDAAADRRVARAGALRRLLRAVPDACGLRGRAAGAVIEAWRGLGYNRRALHLHAAARRITAAGGRFPDDLDGLLALPGVGPYTARAVLSLAFERDVGSWTPTWGACWHASAGAA